MAKLARCVVLASGAAVWTFVLGVSGCGLDAVGSLEAPGNPAAPYAGDASLLDAPPDVTDDAADADAGPPPPGLCDDPAIVLCVRFDGSAVDGAHGQRINVTGNVSYVTGVDGKAALLGATSAVTSPDGPAWQYTSLTVEMWARPDALPTGGRRAGLLDKDGSFGVFTYSDGTVGCILNQTAVGKAFATVATWVHVACVNDGKSTTLYVDGSVKATVAAAKVSPTSALAAIGNNSPDLGDPWIGALDTLRVYSRAKSAAEIAADAKH